MMRRFFSVFLAAVMFTSLFMMTANAAEEDSFRPEIVITKISPNPDWPGGGDPVEAFEIVNTSGKELSLYDYTMFYNGNPDTHKTFGTVTRYTPFKAGDFRDETNYTLDVMPSNPDEFIMAPGEVVVVWVITADNVEKAPALTDQDLRDFWNIPESVRIFYFDGTNEGESTTNFNLKNSKSATYGIIRNDVPMVLKETTYEQGESYCVVVFDDAAHPCINNGILVYGFDGVRQMTEIDYSADGIQLGVLTDAQKESLGDLLGAETAGEQEAAAEQETTAAEAQETTAAAEQETTAAEAQETTAAAEQETTAAAQDAALPSNPQTGDSGALWLAGAFLLALGGFFVGVRKRAQL